jgi:hypothetical protein
MTILKENKENHEAYFFFKKSTSSNEIEKENKSIKKMEPALAHKTGDSIHLIRNIKPGKIMKPKP